MADARGSPGLCPPLGPLTGSSKLNHSICLIPDADANANADANADADAGADADANVDADLGGR